MITRLFQVTEDDLSSLENCLSLIMVEGTNNELWDKRPDIRDSWLMVKEILSNVRFNYGPPLKVEKV